MDSLEFCWEYCNNYIDYIFSIVEFWLCYINVIVNEYLGYYDLFFFQAEDSIRNAQESRGLGDVYKRQASGSKEHIGKVAFIEQDLPYYFGGFMACLLYTSDAADELLCVDLGGRRITKKKITLTHQPPPTP